MIPGGLVYVPAGKPLVSFLIPTHGRLATQPNLLREALYFLTRQTAWGVSEVVILNDCPNHTVTCSVPRVRVYNESQQYGSLGEKMNALVDLALADVCVRQDDDDVSLRLRGERSLRGLDGYDYFVPGAWWFCYLGKPPVVDRRGVGHMACAFRRNAFLGKWPAITHGEDEAIHHYGLTQTRVNPWRAKGCKEVDYCYLFNRSQWHLSGHKDMNWAWGATPRGPHGTYDLAPGYETDWQAVIEQQCP